MARGAQYASELTLVRNIIDYNCSEPVTPRSVVEMTEARFEEEITHMAANLLAISLNAAYVTAGIAVELSPIDYPHELVALSAQRLHALADEVAHVVGKGVLSSMTVI